MSGIRVGGCTEAFHCDTGVVYYYVYTIWMLFFEKGSEIENAFLF